MIAPGDLHLGDASEPADLEPLLDDVGCVIYCAGGLLPVDSQADPERDALLTLRPLRGVLEALAERRGSGLMYVSSGGTVYGDPDELPVSETAPTRPQSSYGKLHLTCEEEISRHGRDHGLAARILRCSTVYGEHQRPDRGQGAVVTFLHRIRQGLPIDLYGGGSTIRDYIYAGDVARAIADLLEQDGGPSLLNVGSGTGTSLLELLKMIEAEVGLEATVNSHPERTFDVHKIVLDTSRLTDLVNFQPTPIEQGIARTHRWLSASTPIDPTEQPELHARQ
jgi:UDP-glucose 4-epimerase